MGHIQPGEAAVGLVQHIDLYLVFNHALLVGQVVLGDVQPAHPVRFGPEHGFQFVGRDNFKIVGEVKTGGAIEHAPVFLDQLDEFHFPQVLRSLEHHMLKQVGKAGAILRLNAEADVVIDGYNGGGGGVVLREDHLQPVVEFVIRNRNLEFRYGGFGVGIATAGLQQ